MSLQLKDGPDEIRKTQCHGCHGYGTEAEVFEHQRTSRPCQEFGAYQRPMWLVFSDVKANKWDRNFLELAEKVASWSKDRSTHVGAVIVGSRRRVLSLGYNGFPRGVDDTIEALHERPEKYFWAEHGERNAIYNATESLEGATIYVSAWKSEWCPKGANGGNLPICMDCARAIVQVGIKRVVTWAPTFESPQWNDHISRTPELFRSAGVALVGVRR